MPDGWSTREAATLTLSGIVVCSILDAVGPVEGKRCLVVGASGSLGTMLLPALKNAGATVWAVCSGRNAALVEGLGAARALDYRQSSFGSQLADEARCVDISIDLVGGIRTQEEALAVTREQGCFATVVGPEQHVGEQRLGALKLTGMMGRIGWSVLKSKVAGPSYRFVGPLAPDWNLLDSTIVKPGIRPTIDRVVPFEQDAVREAIAYVARHRSRGRVVLEM